MDRQPQVQATSHSVPTPAHPYRLATLLLLLTATALPLAFSEMALRRLAPIPDPYHQLKLKNRTNDYIRSEFPRNYHTITTGQSIGLHGQRHFSINNMGLRGAELVMPKPLDEFRIFIVGGSVVECLALDDSESLDAVLERSLQSLAPKGTRVRVYGAARSGDRIDDHIPMIMQRLVHLEPDAIVLLAGVNDLTASIYQHDYLHFPKAAVDSLDRISPLLLLGMFATETQLGRRIHRLVTGFRVLRTEKDVLEEIRLDMDYRDKIQLRQSVPVSDLMPRVDTASYRRNLRSLVGAVRTNRIELVLLTQPSTWNSRVDPVTQAHHWMLYRKGVTYREDRMDAALEALNDEVRALSVAERLPLYDLARDIPKSSTYFYDDVHFLPPGAAFAGTHLAERMKTLVD